MMFLPDSADKYEVQEDSETENITDPNNPQSSLGRGF